MYRAAERGDRSFVAVHRGRKRDGGYTVKVMTILQPTFEGTVRQETAPVTARRRAGFSLGRSSSVLIEDLLTLRTFEVDRSTDLVAGGIMFSGPGCYRLALEAQGERYEFRFPVAFAP